MLVVTVCAWLIVTAPKNAAPAVRAMHSRCDQRFLGDDLFIDFFKDLFLDTAIRFHTFSKSASSLYCSLYCRCSSRPGSFFCPANLACRAAVAKQLSVRCSWGTGQLSYLTGQLDRQSAAS